MAYIKRRGLMLVLSSPSGAGKTTLAQLLLKVDKHLYTSISYTTRPIRNGEQHGVHYYFVDTTEFQRMIENDEFLEYAKVFGNFYGTPKKFVEEKLLEGQDVLFDIDWQGNRSLSKVAKDDVVSIFIFPPSKNELLARLKSRAQDDIKVIIDRMKQVDEEISHWHEYDYSIINRDLDESLKKILSVLRAERLKKARRLGVPRFVEKLLNEKIENLIT